MMVLIFLTYSRSFKRFGVGGLFGLAAEAQGAGIGSLRCLIVMNVTTKGCKISGNSLLRLIPRT